MVSRITSSSPACLRPWTTFGVFHHGVFLRRPLCSVVLLPILGVVGCGVMVVLFTPVVCGVMVVPFTPEFLRWSK
ncbi:hypothetical protein L195_g014226 [Trifolium pratense]|uniref:Transmembrane protein n=1 Tax=Trifolium pratense TaxID=57577 RepID=A0A2K3PQB2_TRIPR|nr:hypothetical protein L195_g014226 [Trifolium pratense]